MKKKKLTYNSLAFSTLKNRKKSYALMIIGIVLAMIFSSGVPFFASCLHSSQKEMQYRKLGKQTSIVANAQNYELNKAIEDGSVVGEIGYAHILSYVWNEKEDFSDGTMIGWLDKRATELYYPIVLDGRMPEKENEIAIEKSALQRMRLDTKIGEEITLKTLVCNSDEFLKEETEVTYKLVGVLYDKKTNYELFSGNSVEKAGKLPAAFVAKNTQVEIGGKEALVAFFNESWIPESYLTSNVSFEDQLDSTVLHATSMTDSYSKLTYNLATVIFISVLLAFMSCFGIVNAFNSNLKERKKQIGMLKAVGATRRQLITVFGREALLICLFSTPLSVGISFGTVKLFAKIMGENFIFKPNFTVLILGTLAGVVCVMLSAIIPLFSVSRLSPMQAIRNIEMIRKMKNKKIKSEKSFVVSNHLAKRKLIFSKGKSCAIASVIACSVIISSWALAYLNEVIGEPYEYYDVDYQIRHFGGFGSTNGFINDLTTKNAESPLTENKKYEVLEIPQVADVWGIKTANLNIVFDGEIPEYLQVNEYTNHALLSSRYINSANVYYDNLVVTSGDIPDYKYPELTEETVKDFFQAGLNPDYTYTKDVAKFKENEELFNVEITGQSPELFVTNEITKDNLIAGEINIDKLNSGEEVIIYAPEKIGFVFSPYSDGGYSSGIHNLSDEVERNADREKDIKDNLKVRAKNPFKVGDTLKLSLLCDDGKGDITREDKEVKIGAIVGKKSSHGYFEIYTTLEGFDTLNTKFNYEDFKIVLKEECTLEIDEIMQTELSSIFPGKEIRSIFAINEADKQEKVNWITSIASFILVFLCVSISLINNSISAQIRDGKRALGTLRAVGASEKELVSSYVTQILYILILGFGIGTVFYLCSSSFIGELLFGIPFNINILPIIIMFVILALTTYINLKVKIKSITKNSIVENIREL